MNQESLSQDPTPNLDQNQDQDQDADPENKHKSLIPEIYLSYGDVIQIQAPSNPSIHNHMYILDFLDLELARVLRGIDTQTQGVYHFELDADGKFLDASITSICILYHRPGGVVEKQGWKVGQWFDIWVGLDIPGTFTAKIVQIEFDRLTLELLVVDGGGPMDLDQDKDPENTGLHPAIHKKLLFWDFAYQGMPFSPRMKWTLRDAPPKLDRVVLGSGTGIGGDDGQLQRVASAGLVTIGGAKSKDDDEDIPKISFGDFLDSALEEGRQEFMDFEVSKKDEEDESKSIQPLYALDTQRFVFLETLLDKTATAKHTKSKNKNNHTTSPSATHPLSVLDRFQTLYSQTTSFPQGSLELVSSPKTHFDALCSSSEWLPKVVVMENGENGKDDVDVGLGVGVEKMEDVVVLPPSNSKWSHPTSVVRIPRSKSEEKRQTRFVLPVSLWEFSKIHWDFGLDVEQRVSYSRVYFLLSWYIHHHFPSILRNNNNKNPKRNASGASIADEKDQESDIVLVPPNSTQEILWLSNNQTQIAPDFLQAIQWFLDLDVRGESHSNLCFVGSLYDLVLFLEPFGFHSQEIHSNHLYPNVIQDQILRFKKSVAKQEDAWIEYGKKIQRVLDDYKSKTQSKNKHSIIDIPTLPEILHLGLKSIQDRPHSLSLSLQRVLRIVQKQAKEEFKSKSNEKSKKDQDVDEDNLYEFLEQDPAHERAVLANFIRIQTQYLQVDPKFVEDVLSNPVAAKKKSTTGGGDGDGDGSDDDKGLAENDDGDDKDQEEPVSFQNYFDSTRRILAKAYSSEKEMLEDLGEGEEGGESDLEHRVLYHDVVLDDTPYWIQHKYSHLGLPSFVEVLVKEYHCPLSRAHELAQRMIRGKRVVQEGEYAVVKSIPTVGPNPVYFKRVRDTWIQDPDITAEAFLPHKELFCSMKKSGGGGGGGGDGNGLGSTELRNLYVQEFQDRLQLQDKQRQNQMLLDLESSIQDFLARKTWVDTVVYRRYNDYAYWLGRVRRRMDRDREREQKRLGRLQKDSSVVVRWNITSPATKKLESILNLGNLEQRMLALYEFVECGDYVREAVISVVGDDAVAEDPTNANETTQDSSPKETPKPKVKLPHPNPLPNPTPPVLESVQWMYCISTHQPILPVFQYELAKAYRLCGRDAWVSKLDEILHKDSCSSSSNTTSVYDSIYVDETSGWMLAPLELQYPNPNLGENDLNDHEDEKDEMSEKPSTISLHTMIVQLLEPICLALGIHLRHVQTFVVQHASKLIQQNVVSESSFTRSVRSGSGSGSGSKDSEDTEGNGKYQHMYHKYYATNVLCSILAVLFSCLQTNLPPIPISKKNQTGTTGQNWNLEGFPLETEKIGDTLNLTGVDSIIRVVTTLKSSLGSGSGLNSNWKSQGGGRRRKRKALPAPAVESSQENPTENSIPSKNSKKPYQLLHKRHYEEETAENSNSTKKDGTGTGTTSKSLWSWWSTQNASREMMRLLTVLTKHNPVVQRRYAIKKMQLERLQVCIQAKKNANTNAKTNTDNSTFYDQFRQWSWSTLGISSKMQEKETETRGKMVKRAPTFGVDPTAAGTYQEFLAQIKTGNSRQDHWVAMYRGKLAQYAAEIVQSMNRVVVVLDSTPNPNSNPNQRRDLSYYMQISKVLPEKDVAHSLLSCLLQFAKTERVLQDQVRIPQRPTQIISKRNKNTTRRVSKKHPLSEVEKAHFIVSTLGLDKETQSFIPSEYHDDVLDHKPTVLEYNPLASWSEKMLRLEQLHLMEKFPLMFSIRYQTQTHLVSKNSDEEVEDAEKQDIFESESESKYKTDDDVEEDLIHNFQDLCNLGSEEEEQAQRLVLEKRLARFLKSINGHFQFESRGFLPPDRELRDTVASQIVSMLKHRQQMDTVGIKTVCGWISEWDPMSVSASSSSASVEPSVLYHRIRRLQRKIRYMVWIAPSTMKTQKLQMEYEEDPTLLTNILNKWETTVNPRIQRLLDLGQQWMESDGCVGGGGESLGWLYQYIWLTTIWCMMQHGIQEKDNLDKESDSWKLVDESWQNRVDQEQRLCVNLVLSLVKKEI